LQQNSERVKILRKKKNEAIKKYNLSKQEKEFFDNGSDMVFIKFYRKGIFAESYYSFGFLLEQIGNRIGCDKIHVINMLPTEILASLEIGYFPKDLIKARIKSGVLFSAYGQTSALSKKLDSSYTITKEKKEKNDIIKGQIAYPGHAKGYVKLINSAEDMKKFEKGNILISRSTNPSLLPAMKLSDAIVTDAGGLTCHAAIVAREMKKPCVVGTKVATQILKDGDLVEVDAKKGIIKVLK